MIKLIPMSNIVLESLLKPLAEFYTPEFVEEIAINHAGQVWMRLHGTRIPWVSYNAPQLTKQYLIDLSKYDVVIGFRADDAYYRFPLDFVRGNITLEQLEYSFNLGELGIQYVITSQKGINNITFIKSFISEDKYIRRYFNTVDRASKAFDSLDKDEKGTRIFDILKEDK